MPEKILMPALSPTMKEGTIAKWLKREGEKVNVGDVLAEIETDKATMEVESVEEGVLGKIILPAGPSLVKVSSVIGIILLEDEDSSSLVDYQISDQSDLDIKKITALDETKENHIIVSKDKTTNSQGQNFGSTERIFASPIAKKIAAEKAIDLSVIKGTGPKNRIVKHDVMNFQSSSVTSEDVNFITIPLTNIRKTIAARLTESKQNIPHFYLSIDCQIDQLLDIRYQINSSLDSSKISVNDFIVRAAALSLEKEQGVNSGWGHDNIVQYKSSDVCVAVAIDNGLITPVVKQAHKKTISTISNEIKNLVNRAKAGLLSPEEYQGGSFTISNLGMFGVKDFSAIINPPQGAILAVGGGRKIPYVLKDDSIVVRNIMTVTLSCDHRVMDGAVAANWLKIFKEYIENPMNMLI